MRDSFRSARDKLSLAPVALRAAVFNRSAHALARLRYMMPDAHPSRFDIDVESNVPYRAPHGRRAAQDAHLLDVYMPTRAPKPLPVVMYVHGGAFCMLSKDTHRVMALSIARRGYLVFNINYRLGPRHTYPAPLEDVCDALAWVHANCARYGGDPDRLAIAGESAGGNLVTALAIAASYRRPEPFARRIFDLDIPLRAVIATYGFLDIAYIDRYLANPKLPRWMKAMLLDAAKSYMGANVHAGVARSPLASPLTIIESSPPPERPLPPFFLSVGTRDPLIRCSKRLKAALDRADVACELHVSKGEIHGYDAMVWRPMAKLKWRAAHDFLTRHMAPPDARVRDGLAEAG